MRRELGGIMTSNRRFAYGPVRRQTIATIPIIGVVGFAGGRWGGFGRKVTAKRRIGEE
jgi:hypothetical protein